LAAFSAGRDTSWTAPSVRISLNYTFRRMIERVEGGGNKKIMVGASWNKHC